MSFNYEPIFLMQYSAKKKGTNQQSVFKMTSEQNTDNPQGQKSMEMAEITSVGIEDYRKSFQYKLGFILVLSGQILIILQCLIGFSFFMEITSEIISYGLLIPLVSYPIIDLLLFVSEWKNIRGLNGFSYFLLFFLAALSFYVGAGWMFGSIYIMVGGLLVLAGK